jgi:hypothetical protein
MRPHEILHAAVPQADHDDETEEEQVEHRDHHMLTIELFLVPQQFFCKSNQLVTCQSDVINAHNLLQNIEISTQFL